MWHTLQCHMIELWETRQSVSVCELHSTKLTLALFRTSLSAPRASAAQDLVKSPKPPMPRYSLSICLAEMMASAWGGKKSRGVKHSHDGLSDRTSVINWSPSRFWRKVRFRINHHTMMSLAEMNYWHMFHPTILWGATKAEFRMTTLKCTNEGRHKQAQLLDLLNTDKLSEGPLFK